MLHSIIKSQKIFDLLTFLERNPELSSITSELLADADSKNHFLLLLTSRKNTLLIKAAVVTAGEAGASEAAGKSAALCSKSGEDFHEYARWRKLCCAAAARICG